MRYFFISCIMFLLLERCIHAQIEGYYSHALDEKREIDLDLFPTNHYSLTWIINFTDDMHTVGHLSCGNWRIDNDKIILTDRDNNFQISCTYTYTDKARNYLKNGIEITAGESFKWLTGLKFQKWLELDKNNYYDLPDFTDFPFQSNFNQTLALHEREEHCFDENKNTLLFGEYTNGYYHLWINPDNTYSLNVAINEYDLREKREVLVVFNDFSQSEGIWEREGNVLTLFDTSVKCPFYLIITEEGLKPNQMMFSLHEHLYIFEYKQQFQE